VAEANESGGDRDDGVQARALAGMTGRGSGESDISGNMRLRRAADAAIEIRSAIQKRRGGFPKCITLLELVSQAAVPAPPETQR
jgi:hypothetical protein